MAHPQVAAFARLAEGGAAPTRRIEGQKTMLGRTMHSVAYDAIHDEFMVPQEFGQAILTFRGGADGEEPPIRVIQGPRTGLTAPDHLDLDPVHNEIFVPLGDKILVFPREARGDVPPIRVIQGPDTMLSGTIIVAVDPLHDVLVADGPGQRGGTTLLIFNRTDSGNVKPKATIGGPKSKLGSLGGPFAVYPKKGAIIASIRGGGEFAATSSEDAFVGVWSIFDNGDVPPKWTIGGPKGVLRMPRGIALDEKHKTLMVSDKRLNAVLTFSFPELF